MISRERIEVKRRIGREMFKKWHGCFPEHASKDYFSHRSVESMAGGYGKTKVPCSRWCCGNPRKHFNELTLQEKRAPTIDEWN